MLSLSDMAKQLDPLRTTLLLGAGVSVTSGAPTGAELSRTLAAELDPPPSGDDLSEICGIYENRRGRKELVKSIRRRLLGLEPSGALAALPSLPWRAIYTTNFDQLVERSYQSATVDLNVIRSNYDFESIDRAKIVTLYKIHGCIRQDIVDGHKARLLLTERDYGELQEYRGALFRALQFDMATSDTLIVGQSLRDLHLREMAKEVAKLADQGASGKVLLLTYENDPDRALLFEQKGFLVASGSFEDLLHNLLTINPDSSRLVHSSTSIEADKLPPALATVTIEVSRASQFAADEVRLFNGSPATYGDIAADLTIKRGMEARLLKMLEDRSKVCLILTGTAGVGKTSLARSLLFNRHKAGVQCWEHSGPYLFDADSWIAVESGLRQAGRQAFLLVDDCVQRLSTLNKLAEHLGNTEQPHLRLILTANSHQWKSHTKSPVFFSKGIEERLSRLTESDLEQLVNLVERQPKIRRLVEQRFALLPRHQRIRRLRDRCHAEMYVCLKNIFGSEQLDDILLKEFAELSEREQDIYRHVAVLQAMGCRVHRQLILKLLGVDAGSLSAMLALLDGIVEEYDIEPHSGLYGWSTRHDVIAAVIATYKFSDPGELLQLLRRLIDGINPSVWLELETARSICTTEWGIERLPNPEDQIILLRQIIRMLPAERTPRRRLVRKFLDANEIDKAAQEIQLAKESIGQDHVIDRYGVRLAMARAEYTRGILDEDRIAMLHTARTLALACINRNSQDRQSYRIYADVGVALARRAHDVSVLDDALARMREAEQTIMDPELSRDRRSYEQQARSFRSSLSE